MNLADTIGPWVAIVAFMVATINTGVIWILMPGKEAEKKRAEAERKRTEILEYLKVHDRRIQELESNQQHLPTKDDLYKLAREVVTLGTEVEGLGNTVRRMDDYLRSAGK